MGVFIYQLMMNKLKKQLFKKEPSTVFEHLKVSNVISWFPYLLITTTS